MTRRSRRRATGAMAFAGALAALSGITVRGADAQDTGAARGRPTRSRSEDGRSTAQADGDAARTSPLAGLAIRRERLANGLRVVMNPDATVPTVAVAVYYDVGSRNEEAGRSGFAHLFEHMMFQGSANVDRGEHFSLVMNRGGSMNGTTSEDRTNYYETLPSNELELGLFLEADRMRSLAITQSNFENQRLVVISERQQSYENRAYAPSFLRINELAYQGYWPYEHSTIGDTQDLVDAPLSAVQAFWQEHYAPNNAVLSIAGDFEPDAALALIRQHFEGIAARTVPAFTPPPFTPQTGERTDRITDPHADVPAFHMAWHIPQAREPDHYALELLALVLGDGDSSRLYQELVKERELVSEISVGTDDRRGPDLFSVFALVQEGHTGPEIRPFIEAAIARIGREGVSARELEKLRNRLQSFFIFGLQRNLERAQTLAEYELYWGDAELVRGELARYMAVQSDDIRRVAAQYFSTSGRTVLDVVPAAEGSEGGAS